MISTLYILSLQDYTVFSRHGRMVLIQKIQSKTFFLNNVGISGIQDT